MVSEDILVLNKSEHGIRMKNNFNTSKLLKRLFKDNWEEPFIFNSINGQILTYKDFFNAVLNCKKKLENIGFKKGDIICFFLPNSSDILILYFAILTMQMVAVPIDINKGRHEIIDMLSQLNYKGIIYDNIDIKKFDILQKNTNIEVFKHLIYKKRDANINELEIFNSIDYNKLFLITFTSGSTGIPKGVMHSFNNLVLSAIAFNKRFNFGKKDIFYHNLPMSYMAGILNLFILPFISGGKIVISERFSISNILRFWEIPIKYSVNTFWFVPTIISLLIKFDRGNEGIDNVKNQKMIGCVGTAHLDIQIKKVFEEKYKNIKLFESYGLSETLFVTTNYPEGEKTGSAGKIIEDVKLSILKDGEILIYVPWMFLGYLNSKTNLEQDKFLSGDIGKIDKEGFLEITGRKKDLIIRGGINISGKRIEDFISNFNIFEECVILGIKDVDLGEKIVCFFVPNDNFNENKKKELNKKIIEKLGTHYTIDEFVKMDNIPKNINGKVDKLKIREVYT